MKLSKIIQLLVLVLCISNSSVILPIKISFNRPNIANLIEIEIEEKEPTQEPEYKKRWGILRTLATGITTGACTGILAQHAEHYSWPLVWYLTYMLRSSIISGTVDVAKYYNENPNSTLLYVSAWVSDWIAYILALQYKAHSSLPQTQPQ